MYYKEESNSRLQSYSTCKMMLLLTCVCVWGGGGGYNYSNKREREGGAIYSNIPIRVYL